MEIRLCLLDSCPAWEFPTQINKNTPMLTQNDRMSRKLRLASVRRKSLLESIRTDCWVLISGSLTPIVYFSL